MPLKDRIVIVPPLIILIGIFFSTVFGQTAPDIARAARASALQELLASIEGTARESPQIFKTKEGYLRFVGAPPSTDFPVEIASRRCLE